MTNILFFTNKAPKYRLPFFNALAKKLNIKFVFTHENNISGLNAKHIISKGKGYKKYRFHLDLLNIIKKEKPKKIVLLPPDPLHLIDNILLYNYVIKHNIEYYIWVETWNYKKVPFKNKFNEFLMKKIFFNAKKILVSGKKSFEFMLKFVTKDKIKVVGDVSEIKVSKEKLTQLKQNLIKKYNLHNKKIILYVGRLIKRKGINYLIDAFSKIKDKNIVLLIVGGDDFYNLGEPIIKARLLNMVKKYNLSNKIIFTGALDPKGVAAAYSISNVLVVPSITDKIGEPWGLIVNEAMQFGLPVIATDAVGSAYDLIKNGKNGFIVKEKNSKELQIAIEKIIYNPVLKNKMTRYNIDFVKKEYNYKMMINNFIGELK